MKNITLTALTVLIVFESFAFAGNFAGNGYVPATNNYGATHTTDTKLYAGLKWTLNEGAKPEAVIGFRRADINSSGHTDGQDVSITAKFIDSLHLADARFKYFNGTNDIQAEANAGYNFLKGLFVGASANAAYSNAGVDYFIGESSSTINPYLMVDTLSHYHKPSTSTSISCPSSNPYFQNNRCSIFPPAC